MIMTSSVSIVISDYIIPVIQMSLYTTLLFVTFIVHYIMMTSHVKNKTTGGGGVTSSGSSEFLGMTSHPASKCSVEQHTFIAKLFSRVFREVNDDITSYKINYNTIQNSSFQVRGSHWE